MGLLSKLFGTNDSSTECTIEEDSEGENDDEDEEERPPKPPATSGVDRIPGPKYEVKLEYDNGDTETVECMEYERTEHEVILHHSPFISRGVLEKPYSYKTRKINYSVLACEPEINRVGTAVIVLEYDVQWRWEAIPRMYWRGAEPRREWQKHKIYRDLTVEEQ